MKTIYIGLIAGAVGLLVALFFQDSRDWLSEIFEEVFSFEWLGDFWDFIGSMFDGIGELSMMGVAFGLLGAGMIFLLKKWMLNPFLVNMTPMSAIIWGGATYIGTFIAGYLMGKGFDNT